MIPLFVTLTTTLESERADVLIVPAHHAGIAVFVEAAKGRGRIGFRGRLVGVGIEFRQGKLLRLQSS